MSRSTGTPKGVDQWLRAQKVDPASSSFVLGACEMDGVETVATWEPGQVTADPTAWAEELCALVDEDATGRGQTTRYQLQHLKDGVKGTCVLRRVIARESVDIDKFDGTNSGLVAKLLNTVDKAYSQLLESNRIAVETQARAMQLLGQSYTLLAAQQATTAGLHTQVLKGNAELSRAEGGGKNDDIVSVMIREMGPATAVALVEKVLPKFMPDLFKDTDKPADAGTAEAAE